MHDLQEGILLIKKCSFIAAFIAVITIANNGINIKTDSAHASITTVSPYISYNLDEQSISKTHTSIIDGSVTEIDIPVALSKSYISSTVGQIKSLSLDPDSNYKVGLITTLNGANLIRSNIYTNLVESTGTAGQDDDHNGYSDDIQGYNWLDINKIHIESNPQLTAPLEFTNNIQFVPLIALDKNSRTTKATLAQALDYAITEQVDILITPDLKSIKSTILDLLLNQAAKAGIVIVQN